ncbi:MAG: BON domain-containing protein [Chloroflexi bacterium]|nr:BON domain-containing protein [Chloroflexota bacterium]
MVDAHVVLGKVHAQLGDFEAASASWRRALELEPEEERAQAGLRAVQAVQSEAAEGASRRQILGRGVAVVGVALALLVGAGLGRATDGGVIPPVPAPALATAPPAPTALPASTPGPAVEAVRQVLQADPLGKHSIEIHLLGNGVRLVGTVPSLALKALAEERARGVPAIALVDSSGLRVSLPPLAETVQKALSADPLIGLSRLVVETVGEEGVTLRGTVDGPEGKSQAERAALAVPGVRFVDSSGVLVAQPPLADRVQAAVRTDEELSALEVVQVGNRLRLLGAVPRPELKTRAEAIARVAAGTEPVDSTELAVVPTEHEVQPGDTLWSLAGRLLGNPRRWEQLYQLNRDRIAQPGLIQPGMRLRLPLNESGGDVER